MYYCDAETSLVDVFYTKLWFTRNIIPDVYVSGMHKKKKPRLIPTHTHIIRHPAIVKCYIFLDKLINC